MKRLMIVVMLSSAPVMAQPLELDEQGLLDVEPAEYLVSFESSETNAIEVDGDAPAYSPDALAGEQALLVGGDVGDARLALSTEDFTDRRVEVRLWAQPRGTDLYATLEWGPTDDGPRLMLGFVETGRVTSDGWRELSSGPVDFEAGMLSASVLRLADGLRRRPEWDNGIPGPIAARVAVDAITIEDVEARRYAANACALPTRAADCGEGGACVYGVCIDGVIANGNPPLTEEGRMLNAERRRFMFEAFVGERRSWDRSGFASDFDSAVSAPRGDYYPLVRSAIARQSFGHGRGPHAAMTWVPENIGLCVMPGTADLLPEDAQLPLLSLLDDTVPELTEANVGDALVAIDGIPPAEWLALLGAWEDGQATTVQEIVRQGWLVQRAALRGATLTFNHCPRTDGARCDAGEIVERTIDLAPLVQAQAWVNEDGMWRAGTEVVRGRCDYRSSHPDGAPPDGDDDDWFVSENVDGVVRLAYNAYYPSDFDAWETWVQESIGTDNRALILDQRRNAGGQPRVGDVISNFVVEVDARVTTLDFFAGEIDAPFAQAVNDCLERYRGGMGWPACGSLFMSAEIPTTEPATHPDWPVAVLNGNSVSMAEYILIDLRQRSAPVRVFGLTPRTGGNLGLVQFGFSLDGEFNGGDMQLVDTLLLEEEPFMAGPVDWLSEWGGVPIDEVCLQTQSDAVAGVDTCLEAARAWIDGL